MQTETHPRQARFGWRLAAVLAVVSAGLLTMVATSQPRWEISDEQTLKFDEGDESKTLEVTTSSKNMTQSKSLDFTLEHPETKGADGLAWTIALEGAKPGEKSITLNPIELETGKKRVGFVRWGGRGSEDPDEMPTCSGKKCKMRLTLERKGETLGPVEVKLRASTGTTGESNPPGPKAFDLKQVD